MTDTNLPSPIAEWHREAERALNGRDYRRTHELCLRILAARPDFADALFLLGMVAAEHGNFSKALELVERALRLAPGQSEYHAQRGRCLAMLRRPREAYEAALRALELGPANALTLDTIGVVMTRAGAHAEAVEPFRGAAERDPGNASFQYNLGSALQFVGDFAGAEAAYRRALAANPDYHRAWSALAQVAHAPFSPEEVAELVRRLERASLDPAAELHLCHALAKQLEDEGRYADAFRYLERGKRRCRPSLGYTFEADRALFEAARRTVDGNGGAGFSSTEPIFVVGMPRTGT
ncbi:MAG TPA: tetratricopeptide repeat protein, partial [Myxococcota bacterium]